jgi:GTP 3',8-cyclase
MFDSCNRRIRYLRLSVTDKCNLRCAYCMPAEGVPLVRHEQVLSLEEMADVARAAVSLGFDKVRLTGGEPLVRRGVIELVRMIAGIEGVADFAMTTNGTLLRQFAAPLREAGLGRLNISLDAVDPARYREITRAGRVADAIAGIDAALDAGFAKVKINCVVRESPDEPDARDVAAFGAARGLEVRYIRRMDMVAGTYWPVIGGSGGDCAACDRVRVSCQGRVYPCLFGDAFTSVRELGAAEALRRAIESKPESGRTSRKRFYEIGG